jgi:short-subunit dehydrogenase
MAGSDIRGIIGNSRMGLAYRSAVVTGASSGIGAELARQLASQRIPVGLTARRSDRLDALAGEIRRKGGVAAVAPADAADREATRQAMARLAEALGPIDLLIANAGVGQTVPADRFSAEPLEEMFRVNLLGPCYAIEAVLPGMLERGRGHIVGISSLAAYRGLPGAAGYCASKAGLSSLLEGLRVELRPRGIFVTTVHPGFVRTPMIEGADHPHPFLLEVGPAAARIVRGIAAGRREVNFPWPMVALLSLVRHLPNPLADRLLAAWAKPGPFPTEADPGPRSEGPGPSPR